MINVNTINNLAEILLILVIKIIKMTTGSDERGGSGASGDPQVTGSASGSSSIIRISNRCSSLNETAQLPGSHIL